MSNDREVRRFYRKFVICGTCWNWTGSLDNYGYGRFFRKDKEFRAHRVSYEIHNGSIPDGLHVRHTCDNRLCVNPDHLLAGTNADNMRDKMERGRWRVNTSGHGGHGHGRKKGGFSWGGRRRGESNPKATLSWKQVDEIRALLAAGEARPAIAHRYGVSKAVIRGIATGKTWAAPAAPK